MNTNLKKNESLKLDLTNKLNLIDKKTNFSLQKFDKDLQYDNLLNKKNEIFTKEQFYPNDPFNQDPFFALNNMNLVNRSGFLSRDDLDDGFDNLVEEKLRRNKNKQNLEESFKVLKISKDLRKEKEGLFDRKKF